MDADALGIECNERTIVGFDLARFDKALNLCGGEFGVGFVLGALQDERAVGRVNEVRIDLADDAYALFLRRVK